MENAVQWLGLLLGGGSIGYLLVDRFFLTKEQKGQDY